MVRKTWGRKTKTTDRAKTQTKKDPIIEEIVTNDIINVPIEAVTKLEEPIKPTEKAPDPLKGPLSMFSDAFNAIERKFYTNAFLERGNYTGQDLLSIYAGIKGQHTQMRAMNSPGHESGTADILEQCQELAKLLRAIGYSV